MNPPLLLPYIISDEIEDFLHERGYSYEFQHHVKKNRSKKIKTYNWRVYEKNSDYDVWTFSDIDIALMVKLSFGGR